MGSFEDFKQMVFEAMAGAEGDHKHDEEVEAYAKRLAHNVKNHWNNHSPKMSIEDTLKVMNSCKYLVVANAFSSLAKQNNFSKERTLKAWDSTVETVMEVELKYLNKIRAAIFEGLGFER